MELSKKERLTLINQYKILEALYPEDATWYANHREILEKGYSLHYDDLLSEIYSETSKEQCREVLDILGMYSILTFSYNKLISTGSLNEGEIDPYLIKFNGFDLNDEIEARYLSYTEFFMHDLNRFTELHDKNRSYNSHSLKLSYYRELLDRFNQVYNPMDSSLLGKDDMKKVLDM